MNYLNSKYYVELKDKRFSRYFYHSTEKFILSERKEPNSLRTKYQVINETKLKRNQNKKNDNEELEVKFHPENKPNKNKKIVLKIIMKK